MHWMEICVSFRLRFGVTRKRTIADRDRLLVSCNSVIEMHTFLVALVRNFDFHLPENGQEIMRLRTPTAPPVVVGEEDKGAQLPLKITALKNE